MSVKTAIAGLVVACATALLAACGGGGSFEPLTVRPAPADRPQPGPQPAAPIAAPAVAPTGLAVAYGLKSYAFSWNAVAGATRYELVEDPDGAGPQPAAQVGTAAGTTAFTLHHQALLLQRLGATYTVRACNDGGCGPQGASLQPDPARAVGYVKASNTRSGAEFGWAVAVSGDGNTLAVGAFSESSAASGVGGNQADTSLAGAGAVYVYVRTAGVWSQQAYLKASNPGASYTFGAALALSGDGNTLAVGSLNEDSSATGINGAPDALASNAGAVYVFARTNGNWSQQAYVKAHNTGSNDAFGASVALSADGNTLAVGASGEASAVGGVNTSGTDDSAAWAGAAYVFVRSGTTWTQQAYLKALVPEFGNYFGTSVALTADGNLLAIGAVREAGGSAGVGGNQYDNSAPNTGAVYLFARASGNWSQQEYIKPSNPGIAQSFGNSVALSADGSVLAVGAHLEGTGLAFQGAVYVFTRGTSWSQTAYLKGSNTDDTDYFGSRVALSGDGTLLAVGAYGEDGTSAGINGSQVQSAVGIGENGAAYLFRLGGGSWVQQAYVKPPVPRDYGLFARGLALSANGQLLAIGMPNDASSATGLQGDPTLNSATSSGAVFLY